MAIYSTQVFDYLEAHPIHQHEGDFHSLLEMIHFIFTSSNPVDNDKIISTISQIHCNLSPLDPEQENFLFCALSDLCLENELAFFSHGILVGMYLMTELNGLP